MSRLAPIIAVTLLANCGLAGELVLAERGHPAQYAIVVPAGAVESAEYAALELRDHVRKMTDVELPVVKVGAAEGGMLPHSIFIEPSPKESPEDDDSFRLFADEKGDVHVAGGARGVLYGAYELLETYGGVGWFSSWRTVIPRRDLFSVPETLDDAQRPAFAMRRTSWLDMRDSAFASRLRVNGDWSLPSAPDKAAKYGGPPPFRFSRKLPVCHTFRTLLPPEKHFREHPEWFSEVNGHRKNAPTQLCLTNPDVLRIVTSNVLECIREEPEAAFFGVSQDDWGFYCTCPNCAAVDAEEGSHSGTIVRFVNAVAEAVEKEFPHVFIETLAYQWSRQPPRKTKLRHNVVPCLCTIECGVVRPLAEGGDAQSESFAKDIRGWSALTDHLYVWDYSTNFRNYLHLLPNVYSLGPNLRFFRDNGAKFVYEQGDSFGPHADFAELKAWLIAKLLWNPDQPVEPLLDRFFAGYYGAAAPFVRQYFEEAQALGRAPDAGHWGIYSEVNNPNVPGDFLVWATNIWARAAKAVKDDPDLSYNVRMGALSPLYTIAARTPAGCVAWVSRDATRCDGEGARRIIRELLDAKEATGGRIRWSEWDGANRSREENWRRFLESPLDVRPQDCDILGAEALGSGFKKYGRVVDDPEAMGGKALMLFPTHFERCVRVEFGRVGFDAGAKYRIRVHLRVAKKTGGRGEAFWTGVYDGGRQRVILERPYGIDNTTADYQWYDIIEWVPSADQYFWLGPGRFDQGRFAESPVHDGIFIDAVAIERCE